MFSVYMSTKGNCAQIFRIVVFIYALFHGIQVIGSPADCKLIDEYDLKSCKYFWECTADGLLSNLKSVGGIHRKYFEKIDIDVIGHTPMWLRIHNNRLHCVNHPEFKVKNYRMKVYRALHYITRLNRILGLASWSIPNNTEWWSHHSDMVKVPDGRNFPPVFSVSGAPGYADIAGIPFMSFSDKISLKENAAFERMRHLGEWNQRKDSAFFRGSLSDCKSESHEEFIDVQLCARAKIVYYSKLLQNSLLSDVYTTSTFDETGINVKCKNCTSTRREGENFVHELLTHKYLLDFPGAGNWSRRKSLLLRSGGLIFQTENSGYQFYEFALKPGVHYLPFNPELGRAGVGNLLSRLYWAQNNIDAAKKIAKRSLSFGRKCLTESSIDYFLLTLLNKYSKYLYGASITFPMIDLSVCTTSRYKDEECQKAIQKCWHS